LDIDSLYIFTVMVKFSNSRKAKKPSGYRIKGTHLVILIFSPVLLFAYIAYATITVSLQDNVPTNQSPETNSLVLIKTDFLFDKFYRKLLNKGGDAFWDIFLEEGTVLQKENPTQKFHVMEVGMHDAKQCRYAAKKNFQVYCIEPSPVSTKRILSGGLNSDNEYAKYIQFYQMAAGSETGLDLPFHSTGSTGDHVGGAIDIWKMEKEPEDPKSQSKATVVNVKSVAIDDIIDNKVEPTHDFSGNGKDNKIDKLYLLKVDVQGFEPLVFSGLMRSIEKHKIDFLVLEYWPKGIDFMMDAEEKCVKPVQILQTLIENGYELYATQLVSHPRAPEAARDVLRKTNRGEANRIIFSDLMEHCKFFYKIEEIAPSDDYKMGYWTDFLAVSPEARFPQNPKTPMRSLMRKN